MIIDFIELQIQKFDQLALKIVENPDLYLCFEHVSDFYKAEWLDQFPQGTKWSCTGLDNGAEEFYISIRYRDRYLSINVTEKIDAKYGIG